MLDHRMYKEFQVHQTEIVSNEDVQVHNPNEDIIEMLDTNNENVESIDSKIIE